MKKFINIFLFLLFTHFILLQLAPIRAEETKSLAGDKLSIIPLSGMIDGGIYNSLKRRVEIAKENGSNLIIHSKEGLKLRRRMDQTS